jgi:hypothetical protein
MANVFFEAVNHARLVRVDLFRSRPHRRKSGGVVKTSVTIMVCISVLFQHLPRGTKDSFVSLNINKVM